jgi:hypothetical protein
MMRPMQKVKLIIFTPTDLLCSTCKEHLDECYAVLPSCVDCPLRKVLKYFNTVFKTSIN